MDKRIEHITTLFDEVLSEKCEYEKGVRLYTLIKNAYTILMYHYKKNMEVQIVVFKNDVFVSDYGIKLKYAVPEIEEILK